MTKNCCVSNSFLLKLRDLWEKNSQVSGELSSRHDGCRFRPLTTHAIFLFYLIHPFFFHTFSVFTNFYFASSWKASTRKLSSKITMSCSILTISSWRHRGRYFRRRVTLDLLNFFRIIRSGPSFHLNTLRANIMTFKVCEMRSNEMQQ